ncbi:aminotransferase class III-fold pyridoxal phosphate-dependent enzyme [Bradyrhizobium ottawaense]|uniref:aminotransferase class III-fold pyridoxal phosphate-dependent enzyme n=1 Tax=Bradyrhizobium ottawaense TaxID=931866 RepID=UPI003FA05ECA
MACAAAKANLDLWQDQESRQRVASVATLQEQAIEPFRTDPRFANVRRTGAITALDLKASDVGYLASAGQQLQAFFQHRNLLLRPLGNTIYVMPPYCVAAAGLYEIYAAIRDAAESLA